MFVREKERLCEARKALYQRGYDIIRSLGSGGFSTIFLTRSRQYNTSESLFAVKLIDICREDSTELPKAFEAEIKCLTSILHENVIKIFDHFTSKTLLYIVLEFCEGGAIDGRVRSSQLADLSRQIVSALAHVHGLGIAHRDVKPSNILVDKYGRAKLADFGLSQLFTSPAELSHAFSGSLSYLAPEVLERRPYDPRRADMWSLGVTLYEMATGRLPFEGATASELLKEIRSREPVYPDDLPAGFISALQSMLTVNPKERVSSKALLRMPVFQEPAKKPGLSLRAVSGLVKGGATSAASSLVLSARQRALCCGKKRVSAAASMWMVSLRRASEEGCEY